MLLQTISARTQAADSMRRPFFGAVACRPRSIVPWRGWRPRRTAAGFRPGPGLFPILSTTLEDAACTFPAVGAGAEPQVPTCRAGPLDSPDHLSRRGDPIRS